jgi:hypothetical protein
MEQINNRLFRGPTADVENCDRQELVTYIHDMLCSLEKIAEQNGLKLLAHLIALARFEAKNIL